MSTPTSFRINHNQNKLIIEKMTPSRSHLMIQGATCIGVCLFLIFGYLIGQLNGTTLLKIGSILFPFLIYVGLSLIFSKWRTKENLEFNKNSGLLIYTKHGKHPWLVFKARSVIGFSPPFLMEYLRFPLEKITSVHTMTVDTVDEFEEYLVLYFSEIDTYLAIWEQNLSKIGHKIPTEIAQFLGQPIGKEINKPPVISFSFPFLNNLIQEGTNSKTKSLKINAKKAFLSYDFKLAISAALLTLEEHHRAVQQNPNDAYAHLGLSLTYLGRSWKESAIEHLQIAHRLFRDCGDQRHAKKTQTYLAALKFSA
ncbi:hypothetical protein [Floridanema evergladense]|uniref:Tetratricopeptide repeat protein n=1 Tax=Floridaenema evergladense BLCC-F167 TaxID=3153639 RepID=A0ABV4WIF4_9CYAN